MHFGSIVTVAGTTIMTMRECGLNKVDVQDRKEMEKTGVGHPLASIILRGGNGH